MSQIIYGGVAQVGVSYVMLEGKPMSGGAGLEVLGLTRQAARWWGRIEGRGKNRSEDRIPLQLESHSTKEISNIGTMTPRWLHCHVFVWSCCLRDM